LFPVKNPIKATFLRGSYNKQQFLCLSINTLIFSCISIFIEFKFDEYFKYSTFSMSTPHYYHKVVVITGGSSGIGLALAKEFAKQRAHIMLIARDQERLEAAKGELMAIVKESADVDVFAADVSVEEEITTAIKVIGERYQKINVLINCAGIAACGRFMDLKPDAINNCLQVNYMGAVYATHSAWRYLKLAKGQLSFVSSVAGYIGLIGYSAYALLNLQ
jgi:short-subunit dehydrogenase